MSESQANPNLNNQNSTATGNNQTSGSTPPASPATPTQNSQSASTTPPLSTEATQSPTVMPGAGASVTNDPVQFKSTSIGTQTAKQQDPFAEQNRVAEQKQQKATKIRKKTFIIIGAIVLVVLAGLITWLAILMSAPKENLQEPEAKVPVITSGADSEIYQLRNDAQQYYLDNSKNINAANQFFANELRVTDEKYQSHVLLAQILFDNLYANYDNAVTASENINIDHLTLEQRAVYYDTMYQIYTGLKDTERAGEFFALSYKTQLEINGYSEEEEP